MSKSVQCLIKKYWFIRVKGGAILKVETTEPIPASVTARLANLSEEEAMVLMVILQSLALPFLIVYDDGNIQLGASGWLKSDDSTLKPLDIKTWHGHWTFGSRGRFNVSFKSMGFERRIHINNVDAVSMMSIINFLNLYEDKGVSIPNAKIRSSASESEDGFLNLNDDATLLAAVTPGLEFSRISTTQSSRDDT